MRPLRCGTRRVGRVLDVHRHAHHGAGFSALIYAQIFDLSGSYEDAFYMMVVFYALATVLSLFIVPVGRRSWSKRVPAEVR